jgi:hypothetical protein
VKYTTAVRLVAPPQPMRTMENVAVEMAKLGSAQCNFDEEVPHETQRCWVGESLTKVTCNREFWLNV